MTCEHRQTTLAPGPPEPGATLIEVAVLGAVLLAVPMQATYGADAYLTVVVMSVLIGVAGRVGVCAWLFWERMVWSLTHAQLVVALLAATALLVMAVSYAHQDLTPSIGPGATGFAAALLSTVILSAPLLGAVLAVGVAGVVVLIPVPALPAYVVARRTTGRPLGVVRPTASSLALAVRYRYNKFTVRAGPCAVAPFIMYPRCSTRAGIYLGSLCLCGAPRRMIRGDSG